MAVQLRALACACALVVPLSGADRYVAGSASGTQDGSAAHPWREIRQAIPGLAPGDVVHIADGSYLGFDLDAIAGTSGAPITLQATGTGAVVTVTTDRSDNRDTVLVTQCAWIVIDGLRSANATRAALRVDQSQHVTVRNCVFDHDGTWGIFTDFSDDLLLEGNSCSRSQSQHGIYVSNTCTRPIVRRNRLFSNAANGLHMNGDVSQGGTGVITNALVEFNVIWDNGLGGGGTPADGGSGINCDGVQDSVIRGNLVYAAHGAGITLYQTDGGGPATGNVVVANTVEVASDGKWCLQLHDAANNTTVFDNIFVTQHLTHGALHFTANVDLSTVMSDYNVLGGGAHTATTDDDSTYLTLAQWQATGHDAHSLASPGLRTAIFVDPDHGDFHLASGASAIDHGVVSWMSASAPTLDQDGDPRPSGAGYDIGMDEYVAGGGTATGGTTTGGSTTGGTTTGGTTAGGTTTGGTATGSSSSGSGGGRHCGAGGGVAMAAIGVMALTRRRR